MPERFYQASMLLNTYGPRLKDCRGDEEVGIQRLLPLNNLDSWVFMFLGVIRGIYPLYSFGPLINTFRGDR